METSTLSSIAARYGLPPTLLDAVMAQGVPDHISSTAGMSPGQMQGNDVLQATVIARALQQSFQQYGNWDKALTVYLGGSADGNMNSPISSQVQSILGTAAINPEMGMDSYGGQPNSAMFSDLAQQWQPFADKGGIINQAGISSFTTSAQEALTNYSSSQDAPPGRSGGQFSSLGASDPNKIGGRSYDTGQCTALAANVLTWIPEYAGDAGGWATSVPAKVPGATVGSKPAVGSAVVWQPGQGGAAGAGHVGVVVGVNPDGSVKVLQQNWPEGAGPNISTLSASEAGGLQYISAPPALSALAQKEATTAATQAATGQKIDVSTVTVPVGASNQQTPTPSGHKPGEVSAFAQQAQAAGITDPSVLNKNLPYLSSLSRQLLGRAPTLNEIAETAGMTDQQIRQWVMQQPHPTYPHATAGDMKQWTDKASIYSVNYAGRMPNSAEVSRLMAANASPSDLKDYYSHESQSTPLANQVQDQQQGNVLPMKKSINSA